MSEEVNQEQPISLKELLKMYTDLKGEFLNLQTRLEEYEEKVDDLEYTIEAAREDSENACEIAYELEQEVEKLKENHDELETTVSEAILLDH